MDTSYQAYLDMWAEEYTRARRTGLKHTPARIQTAAKMKEACPEISEVLEVGMASRFMRGDKSTVDEVARVFGSKFGPMVAALRKKLDAEADGGIAVPLLVPTQAVEPAAAKNGHGPTRALERYLEYLNPSIGEIVTFNLHYMAWEGEKVNDSAWRYVFSDDSRLVRAGWKFDVVNKSGKCYQVRVTEKPMSERDRQIVALEQKQAELEAMIAALKSGK